MKTTDRIYISRTTVMHDYRHLAEPVRNEDMDSGLVCIGKLLLVAFVAVCIIMSIVTVTGGF